VDVLYIVKAWITALAQQIYATLNWFWQQIIHTASWAGGIFVTIAKSLTGVAQYLWRGIRALGHLKFSDIWKALKRIKKRFDDFRDWWQRNIQGPIDRIRNQIWQIYRTFFKPILRILDTFRSMIRVVALFNRKLAAKLDHRLMALESKIMWPITTALHRINDISSYVTALITTAGRLARPLLLESMRRDALLVWEVLTNPRRAIYSPPEPARRRTIEAAGRDFREYLEHGTGPHAMTESADHASFLQGFEEAS
jgi:hypothetical protein